MTQQMKSSAINNHEQESKVTIVRRASSPPKNLPQSLYIIVVPAGNSNDKI
jgi:hypothetical protein